MEKQRAKIIGIARHRLSTDGDGVTTEALGFTRFDLFTQTLTLWPEENRHAKY